MSCIPQICTDRIRCGAMKRLVLQGIFVAVMLCAAGGALAQTTTPIYTYSANYDGAGNVLGYSDSVMGTWTFTPDTLNRLVAATNTATTPTSSQYAGNYGCWSYDAFGNRLSQSMSTTACGNTPPLTSWASYNSNNQFTATSQAPGGVTYDASGDVANDGQNQYLYDGEGRICAVARTAVPGTTTMTGYVYDADGTRVAKGTLVWTGSGTPTWNTACSGMSGQGGWTFTTTNDYILGPSGEQVTEMVPDANNSMTWEHTNVWAGGKLLATYDMTGKGLHFYLDDPLGTRRVQTDYAGAIEQTCSSLPFGDGLACTGSVTTPTEHHFTGKERDTESGNDYFGARYYASSMGRFLSPDWSAKVEPVPYAKLDNPQTLNLYAYVGNNPLTLVDPDGHTEPIRFGCSEGQKDCNTDQQKKAQQQSDKNTDVMLMANSGSGPSANPHASMHGMDGTAYMDWAIVPQADNISQLSSDSIKATQDKYSKASILLDEKKPGGNEHWEGSDTGKGHDNINPMALPVTQKWYINTGGGNNSSNQRIQLVIGMKPDGTLIKAWTVQVTAGPAYKKED